MLVEVIRGMFICQLLMCSQLTKHAPHNYSKITKDVMICTDLQH